MLAFDTSSIVHAWDHYPQAHFPALWKWVESEVRRGHFAACEVVIDELDRRWPECLEWFKVVDMTVVPVTEETTRLAAQIKQLLEIVGDRYHAQGVGEVDLFVIASAHLNGQRLVSNEGRQTPIPSRKAKYKMPLVCGLSEVGVDCISFVQLIRESGLVFG